MCPESRLQSRTHVVLIVAAPTLHGSRRNVQGHSDFVEVRSLKRGEHRFEPREAPGLSQNALRHTPYHMFLQVVAKMTTVRARTYTVFAHKHTHTW